MMSTGAITLKDKPGRGRRKSCAAGNREIRRGEGPGRIRVSFKTVQVQ